MRTRPTRLDLIAENILVHRGQARALYRLAPINHSAVTPDDAGR